MAWGRLATGLKTAGLGAGLSLMGACAVTEPVRGWTTMECTVVQDGRLDQCQIVSERPQGHGFGESALERAGQFQMRTTTQSGESTAGSRVRLSMQWRLADDGSRVPDGDLDPPPPEA